MQNLKVDTDIILGPPAKFLAAGIGDAFATYYEARACYKASALNLVGTKITNATMALAISHGLYSPAGILVIKVELTIISLVSFLGDSLDFMHL